MPERSNNLVILSDRQRNESLACYANVSMHSPNIELLASERERFVDVCERNPTPITVFDRMSDVGYPVGYFGKWLLGDARLARIAHWEPTNSEEGHWTEGRESMGSPYLWMVNSVGE